jgi:hypothetical protein
VLAAHDSWTTPEPSTRTASWVGTDGASESTVHVDVAGVGSVTPEAVALTENVCAP